MKISEVKDNSVELWIDNNWPIGMGKPLSNKKAEEYIICCAHEDYINKDKDFKNAVNDGLDKILWNMLTYTVQADVSLAAHFAITSIAEPSSPGECLMIAAYIQYKCKKHQLSKLDAKGVGFYIFPNGAPTHEEFTKLWNAQKIPGNMPDNLLNIQRAYTSIMS